LTSSSERLDWILYLSKTKKNTGIEEDNILISAVEEILLFIKVTRGVDLG
jgi:hypothetical protein